MHDLQEVIKKLKIELAAQQVHIFDQIQLAMLVTGLELLSIELEEYAESQNGSRATPER